MSNTPSFFQRGHTNQRSFALFMGVSFIFHAALLVMMIALSGFSGCKKEAFSESVIHVDLVSLQDFSESTPAADQHTPAEDRVKAKAPAFKKPADLDRQVVSVSDEEAPVAQKTSFKRKTFDPRRIAETPVDRPDEEVSDKEPEDDVAEALSRLRESVRKNQRPGRGGSEQATGDGGRQRQERTAVQIYRQAIRYRILGNWVYSEQLAGNDDGLRAVIGITIAEDGRIIDIWYDKRSGNRYFDESIHKAVVKSDPLPKLPEGDSSYTVKLRFTPSDLQSGN